MSSIEMHQDMKSMAMNGERLGHGSPLHDGLRVSEEGDPTEIALLEAVAAKLFGKPDGLARELKSRYEYLKGKNFACYEAVQFCSGIFPLVIGSNYLANRNLEFGNNLMLLDREVQTGDAGRQSGQFVLTLGRPNSDLKLTIDVAAYLFGFEYSEMPSAIGDKTFTEKVFTNAYAKKFPGSTMTIATTEGLAKR